MTADARRAQFVRAAIEVMAKQGLDRTTIRRIAEHAGAPQGVVHYAFRDKNELLAAVVAEITSEIERIVAAAVDPTKGLGAAIRDALTAFWSHVVGDDGLQLMQYELAIHSRRTPGLEWLAEWQYARYVHAAHAMLTSATEAEPDPPAVDLRELARFLVAVVDGLILQYEVTHDAEQSARDLENAIRAAQALAGVREPAVSGGRRTPHSR